jgi:hypothetical protein
VLSKSDSTNPVVVVHSRRTRLNYAAFAAVNVAIAFVISEPGGNVALIILSNVVAGVSLFALVGILRYRLEWHEHGLWIRTLMGARHIGPAQIVGIEFLADREEGAKRVRRPVATLEEAHRIVIVTTFARIGLDRTMDCIAELLKALEHRDVLPLHREVEAPNTAATKGPADRIVENAGKGFHWIAPVLASLLITFMVGVFASTSRITITGDRNVDMLLIDMVPVVGLGAAVGLARVLRKYRFGQTPKDSPMTITNVLWAYCAALMGPIFLFAFYSSLSSSHHRRSVIELLFLPLAIGCLWVLVRTFYGYVFRK